MSAHTFEGRIATTRSGVGFVSHRDFKSDIKIEHEYLNTALHGDTVSVKLHAGRRGSPQTGEVTRIIARARTRFVGILEYENGFCYLTPDDRRIYTDILIPEPGKDVPNRHKALVELVRWDDPAKDPVGKILEILGPPGEHEGEIASIVAASGIDTRFPEQVARAAKGVAQDWSERGASYIEDAVARGARRDFRQVGTFTIDPRDAKDFDDALSLTRTGDSDRYEVGVHIADVTHFVRAGDTIDREAVARGYSTYLVDRTIPMLPEELSSDLCSLHPNVDRLTFSAVLTLDERARVISRWFGKSVIRSSKRFTYEEAQRALETRSGPHHETLATLWKLAQKLRERRFSEGSIDFEQEEVEVELDEHHKPSKIYRKPILDTNRLIEDFMLLANREIAETIHRAHGGKQQKHTFIYRVHDHPDREKFAQVQTLVRALGYDLGTPGQRVHARDINRLFAQIEGSPVEGTVKGALIRSMARAAYGTENIGHFGLGFGFYTHFTSPIRRYPDVLVHRFLEAHLEGRHVPEGDYGRYGALARALSEKEAVIQEAERESIRYKQVEYMQGHIGKTFSGIITGVTEWGIYVEERATGAEGLVRIASLDEDYFMFDERRYRLVGRKTKKTYTLGDLVRVKVQATNVDQRTIDFVLA